MVKSVLHPRLADEAARLQEEVARLKASRVPGGEVRSGLRTFPSPAFAKAYNESEYRQVKIYEHIELLF